MPFYRITSKLFRLSRPFIVILGFISVFLVFLKPPTDPDLFWHLKNGEIMVTEKRFPLFDEFSYTLAGYKWADSYWLTEVLLFLGINHLGLLGVVMLFTLIAVLSFYIQIADVVKDNTVLSISLFFLFALPSAPFIGVRPQVISIFLFSLEWYLLRKFVKQKNLRSLYFLPLIFLFWANLHAGFLLGLVLLWFFCLLEGGLFVLGKGTVFDNVKYLKQVVVVVLSSTLIVFVNPYGRFLIKTILNDALSYEIKAGIQEWLPVNFHTYMGLLFLFSIVVLVLGWFLKSSFVPRTEPIYISVFVILGVLAIRNIPLSLVLALPSVIQNYKSLKLPEFFKYYRYYAILFLALFPLLFTFFMVPKTLEAILNEETLAREGGFPYEAVNFLKQNAVSGNIFNSYSWGGYLILTFPENKVFIDGRMPGWRTSLGEESSHRQGSSVFSDYLDVYFLKPNFEEILEGYRISLILVEKEAPLATALKVHPEWELLYEDELAVVLTKN